MIELLNDSLVFTFPEVHPAAKLRIEFQRTLRIPDDDGTYPLPPGLGAFPLRHIEDYEATVPKRWIDHGGVMLPMYQSEALWINFDSHYDHSRGSYPFAVKIAAGKINAVSGKAWGNKLERKPQNYLVVPKQPWLDGYCVKKGIIRQFVAMPLGEGYTAEEQLTGEAEHGGVQIHVFPMKREVFEKRAITTGHARYALREPLLCSNVKEMGLAPGGRMKQEIYEDPNEITDWDLDQTSRCYVHIANSLQWKAITGDYPPLAPPTAQQYTVAGLPWFDYYSDDMAIDGVKNLSDLSSVGKMYKEKNDKELPGNDGVETPIVLTIGSKPTNKWNNQ